MRLEPGQALTALLMMKTEIDKIRLQFQRIREDDSLIRSLVHPHILREDWFDEETRIKIRSDQEKSQKALTALFADIHYLLIGLARLDLFLRWLEKLLPSEPELRDVRGKFARLLKDSNDFRNHLEHINERIARGVSDLGNLSGTLFTFDGKQFDVGPALQAEVEAFFEALISGCEAISARQNPRRP